MTLLLALPVPSRAQSLIDLEYTPRAADEGIRQAVELLDDDGPFAFSLRFARTDAPAPGSEEIGHIRVGNPPVRLYARQSVVSFLQGAATTQFKDWGHPLADNAGVRVEADVRRFFVDESYLYKAEIAIGYVVRDPDGSVLWSAEIDSDAKVFGVARKAPNYREALSDAFRKNLALLVARPGFRAACASRKNPKSETAGAKVTPAEAKDAVLRLIKEGLGEDLLVAYVRQARISPAFSADDILQWKGAGIPPSVITAALGAAASTSAP
ncbi:MAG: hypothetical protein KBB14_18740 [Thermoanaerobaculia bacterium]|nr:hypothetical protein [Thermoanaerobaculia bacterium]